MKKILPFFLINGQVIQCKLINLFVTGNKIIRCNPQNLIDNPIKLNVHLVQSLLIKAPFVAQFIKSIFY